MKIGLAPALAGVSWVMSAMLAHLNSTSLPLLLANGAVLAVLAFCKGAKS